MRTKLETFINISLTFQIAIKKIKKIKRWFEWHCGLWCMRRLRKYDQRLLCDILGLKLCVWLTMNVWILLVFICLLLEPCNGSGYFEIQILSMENIRGEISNGSCCGSRYHSFSNHTCTGECATFFSVCLKQYQTQVTVSGQCTFGNRTTQVLGGNSFKYISDISSSSMKLPFQFSWTVSEHFP